MTQTMHQRTPQLKQPANGECYKMALLALERERLAAVLAPPAAHLAEDLDRLLDQAPEPPDPPPPTAEARP